MTPNRFAVLGILLAFCTPAAPPQTPHSIPSHKKTAGVGNFGEVTPNLYRGGQPTREGLENLKNMGVSIVIDMRGGHNRTEKSAVTDLGMEYISIPWHCPFPTDAPFAHFLKIIDDNPTRKIFVHCRLGDDRTGLAVATYRMANEGWSPDEALHEMKEFGYTGIHRAICPGIPRYEKQFPEHLKHNPIFQDTRPSPPSMSK